MKVEWVEIEGTKLVELNYDLTKSIRMPVPKGLTRAIVKVNFVLFRKGYKGNLIDKIIGKIKGQKPALVFVGNIKIKESQRIEREEKSLPLNLTRPELIRGFVKLFAPKKLRLRILKEANLVLREVEVNED